MEHWNIGQWSRGPRHGNESAMFHDKLFVYSSRLDLFLATCPAYPVSSPATAIVIWVKGSD